MNNINKSSVAIVARGGETDIFASSAKSGLIERGFRVQIFNDGELEVVGKDCILFIGSLSALRKTASQMDALGPNRPIAIAWQSESLPPPQINQNALNIISNFSPSWSRERWHKPIMRVIAKPIDYLVHVTGFSGVPKDICNTNQLRFTADNFTWLKRGIERNWLDAIGTSTIQKRLFLEKVGFRCFFLPLGYQTVFGEDLNIERDIDVLFVGKLKSKRRRKYLKRIFDQIRKSGYNVQIAKRRRIGKENAHTINRARIVLHVHQFVWDTPWIRWYLATINGAVIASEKLSVPEPLRPGIDYLSADSDNLVNAITDLLSDEDRRQEMLINCREALTSKMSLDLSLDRLVEMINTIAIEKKNK